MQWIFMLVGLVLGVGASESVTGALLGGLIGLSLGQALRLQGLETRNAQLAAQLKDFAERFERGTRAIHERLVKVEQGERSEPESVPASADPVASSAPEAQPEPVVAEEPELDWTLDPLPEIETSQPVAEPASLAAQVAYQPQSAAQQSPWREQTPREPNLVERGIAAAKAWLFGGNTVLRVGVVLLFLGLAFLLRYATEGVEVPVELRYMGVAASALALLGLGWWLRRRNRNYALVLQGTGIAVLYLTVFAAMRLHPLLDPGMALGLLVAVTLFSAILAVQQNALGLAAAAALGGFAAPILTSTGSGNHVALFSYFALLNAGIFAIAWFKAWRLLNLIGFVGTFGIGFAWGLRSYTPELLWSTEPFLLLFFLMYVAIGLLFARRTCVTRRMHPRRVTSCCAGHCAVAITSMPPRCLVRRWWGSACRWRWCGISSSPLPSARSAWGCSIYCWRACSRRVPANARCCWLKPAWRLAWCSPAWPYRLAWMRAGRRPPGPWKAPAFIGLVCVRDGH